MSNDKKTSTADGLTRRGFLTLGGVAALGAGAALAGMLAAGVFGERNGQCGDDCERGRFRRRACSVAVGRLLSVACQPSRDH